MGQPQRRSKYLPWLLQRSSRSSAVDMSAYMSQVEQLLNDSKYDDARLLLERCLASVKSTPAKYRSRASTMLGIYYYYGLGSKVDHVKAYDYFQTAMVISLPDIDDRSPDCKSEDGSYCSEALFYLGLMHINGEGVPSEVQTGLDYYRQAAKYGYDEAQYKLGMIYKSGKGVAKNENYAIRYFQKASHQNHSKAQNQLAMMYAGGRGVLQDDKQAVYWYKKSAEQGNDIAQYNLGYMYCEGRGVTQSFTEANKWFLRVANGGSALKTGSNTVHSLVARK